MQDVTPCPHCSGEGETDNPYSDYHRNYPPQRCTRCHGSGEMRPTECQRCKGSGQAYDDYDDGGQVYLTWCRTCDGKGVQ